MKNALGPDIFVGSSAGRGILALVPWADISDNTYDEQGLRINLVYNFKADMSGVYLILRVHFYQPDQDKYKKYLPLFLENKSKYMAEFLEENNKLKWGLVSEVDLASQGPTLKLHSHATIVAKYYEKGNIPSTKELVSDINYFLELRKFLLENYKDDTQISEKEWIDVLEEESVIDDKMFNILQIMYQMDDHKATTGQLIEKRQDLGFDDEKSYNSLITANSRRVKEFLNKKTINNFNGTENFWMRLFYGEEIKVEKDGKNVTAFQFKLKDELVEALGKVNRKSRKVKVKKVVGNEANSFYNFLTEKGYLFDKEIIENYLLSLKVKPFAILTGNSGTGKTKLSQLFAQYLNNYSELYDESDEEYIIFKTNNSRIYKEYYNLGKKTIFSLLGLDKYDGFIDIYLDDVKSNEKISLDVRAGTDDKKLINYLKKKDLSDVEIKIRKEDLLNTFLDEAVEKSNILSFDRKVGNEPVWCLPKKELHNFLPIKNKSTWKAIFDGIETNLDFWVHDVFIPAYLSENDELKDYINKKDKNDNIKIKLDLSSFKYKDIGTDLGVNLINKHSSSSNNPNYKIIPVGANWTENRHIVGYYNVITNEYQSTPAYDLIKQAQKSKEPHFLILDEMNLSHVERYFADFLSAIESGENIPLYGEKELEIPSNLFIIGTVNVDETTYMFSPKVLDRANVIEFETYPSKDYMFGNFKKDSPSGNIEYLENPLEGNEIRSYGINELKELFSNVTVDGVLFWDILSKEINKFQEILKESRFDFGFRVINEIVRFMAVAWEYEGKPTEFTNWTRYFDACIKQKLLPKLHGSERIIGETIEELYKICLDSAVETEDMAKYQQSYKKLNEMRKVLRKQRYVSFIN